MVTPRGSRPDAWYTYLVRVGEVVQLVVAVARLVRRIWRQFKE